MNDYNRKSRSAESAEMQSVSAYSEMKLHLVAYEIFDYENHQPEELQSSADMNDLLQYQERLVELMMEIQPIYNYMTSKIT